MFGKTKEAPDEFAVYRRAPLSLPPDIDLRPPTPGASRPQVVTPRDQASVALGILEKRPDKVKDSNSDDSGRLTNGEMALLALTGANKANPQIRVLVEKQNADLYENNETLTDKMIFWQSKEKAGVALDPEKEMKRIREAQALGKPLNSNDIPSIKRKKKALLEGVFD